jgi:lipoyl synthase
MSNKIIFTAPTIKYYDTDDLSNRNRKDFVAVSITGMKCSLMCSHCRTRMLSALYHADTPEKLLALGERLAGEGCKGMLITGGCDKDGILPVFDFVEALQFLKKKYAFHIALHSKLVDERLAQALRQINVDTVMNDVVGDDHILHEVYHLPHKSVADVYNTLTLLAKYDIPLSPHIIIGLDENQKDNELKALQMLKNIRMHALVVVVFTPLKHTLLESQKPPALEKVKTVMQAAREWFPQTKLFLGCAKNYGPYQRAVEEYALELRYNGIAYPSDGLMAYAQGKGFTTESRFFCCALC